MNILIVDDNQDNRMTIELLLEKFENIKITNAEDGKEALEFCKAEEFDLIFMDIMMPVMDGIEATKEIKSFSHNSMIIALSALDDEVSKHKMLESGAEDYMTKPIDSELFLQRVKNYMSIISVRSKDIERTNAVSLFNNKVYPSSLTFKIDDETSLAYFWDYLLNNTGMKAEYISDTVRVIYGFGAWLLKTDRSFSIIVEESDTHIYLTQLDLSMPNELIIKNILLKHCNNSIAYIVEGSTLSFKLKKYNAKEELENNQEKDYQQEILSKTHFDKITATEFVEMTAISFMQKIEDLEEDEDKIDKALMEFEAIPSHVTLSNVTKKFLEYVEVIELLVEFEHISYAIKSLATSLDSVEESSMSSDKVKKFVTLTLHLLADLESWRDNIFVKQDANDIHYLDSSLLSSCLQIESIFKEDTNEEEDDGELEFF